MHQLKQDLGLCSFNGKASYHQISWSLEAAKLDIKMIVSVRLANRGPDSENTKSFLFMTLAFCSEKYKNVA